MNKKYLGFAKQGLLFLMGALLLGCAPYYQDNTYGNGYYPSSSTSADTASSTAITDFQAFQANFLSVSVSQIGYSVTDTLSVISLKGSCLNPNFQQASIYYKMFDAQGEFVANDGYPYGTNMDYRQGTNLLMPSPISCGANGVWSTKIQVPTHILYLLASGTLQVSIVAWYKNTEMHNDAGAGLTSMVIEPPQIAATPTN